LRKNTDIRWRSKEHKVPKEAVFTLKLEPELRDQFVAEAAVTDRPKLSASSRPVSWCAAMADLS